MPTIVGRGSRRRPTDRDLKYEGDKNMGQRKEKKEWQVIEESVYRFDRDLRIKRAYAIAIPDVIKEINRNKGGEHDESQHSFLCTCVG